MRKKYLDNIRWITVVLVVIYHVVYMYNAEGILGGPGKITDLEVQYYDLYLYIVYPWLMMLLFIVSGISARLFLDRHSDKAFIRRGTTRLLVPSTIGLFAFQFIQGYVNLSLGGAFSASDIPAALWYPIMAVVGAGVLWYIQTLWIFYVVLVFIRKVEKDSLWRVCAKTNIAMLILLTIPIWGAAQILNTPVVLVYRFGLYGAAFLLGYFVFSHEEVMEALKKAFFPMALAAAALGIAFCAASFGKNYSDAPVNRSLLFIAYGWFACLSILGGMARYGDFENGFTRWMKQHSFGLYVFHYLGISSTALFLGKPGKVPAWLVYGVSCLAGFAAGYGLNALIARVPFFRWAVLGIEKKRH